ncbi:hypothetical protein VKT23_015475 [Stygiomarasmius scandens]|uniref:Beta-xylanase n=1 Tax=Marasmiellus scandens TaxID=2682957 RepID=A0ABR1IXW2_9AGAR
MKFSLSLASLLCLVLATTAQNTTKLNTAAKAAGKLYFGTATDNPELTDNPYDAILSDPDIFGIITPGNKPAQGQFSFDSGDNITNFIEQNGQRIRGHNCVWYQQLPSWVSDGNFDNATLTEILQTHVSTVVDRYKGRVCKHSWDVVNEPFNDDGTGTQRSFVFTNTIGPSYIDIALQAARAADPDAKLYINDYNIEGSGAKSTAMQDLVKDLKSRNIPIDGVGLQAHLISGALPSDLQENLEAFAAIGIEVAYTELDIRIELPATDEKLEQQRQDYQAVVSACQNVPACVGVTTWDYPDSHSWIPSNFPGEGAALPFDENLQPKPAYDGILAGFK